MKKSTYMYLIPIYNRTIFPYQSVRIRLTESNIYNGRNYNNLVGLIPVLDKPKSGKPEEIKDSQNYYYGTIVKVTGEDKVLTIVGSSHQAQRSITGLGISRFRVAKNGTKVPQGHIDNVEIMKDDVPNEKDQELKNKGLIKQVKELTCQYLDLLHASRGSPEGVKEAIRFEASTSKLLFNICTLLNVDSDEQYRLLCIDDVEERINAIITSLRTLLNSIKLHNDLETKTQEKILADRKTSMLKSKLDEINKMLYGESANEPASLENAIKEANLPQVVKNEVEKELRRLRSMQPHNAEHGVILQYLKTILELPWNTSSTEIKDITVAKTKLDQDHSGLEKVKKRIIEYLAVRNLKGNSKGTIICLCGPPGVGKTSLGKSIAESLGRKFERVSLGGVHDEAEMRGHRRTYIGAMPGVFIKALQRCKTNNPVILLDEIDKLGRDHRGDPSSALLEILDPNQNHTFVDHYLGVPFDLSNIFFIATANKLDTIQPALLDRLEIIQIPGYTFNEKAEIANKYLIPKQIAENGLKPSHMEVTSEALSLMISNYTMEAGVRELERVVAAVCRKVAVQYTDFLDDQKKLKETPETDEFGPLKITGEVLLEMMGPYVYEKDIREKIIHPGVATGMAWTSGGGKVLYVETSYSRGRGKIEITGHLGDVMKESVLTAIGWIKSNFHRLGIDVPRLLGKTGEETDDKKKTIKNDPNSLFENIDLYIHFPAAAIPKDGPSAGITITTALVSLFVNRRVKSQISMTGEISLKGLVLPVGGIKEKCIAAHASGIRKIILPKRNKKDTDEIAAEIKKEIDFVFAETIDEVVSVVLEEEEYKDTPIDMTLHNHGVNKLSKL